ncbi:uncharacterized protein LOC135347932 isoform X1 [Halichondria panicea]|uniref:uncharacterized protein LOC135347932 isoform X1 n=1 Tax=Halichondria panicea TaxID=6063 RepID=UPI00312B952E
MAARFLDNECEGVSLQEPCVNPYCQRKIRQLEEELHRVKSVGYDMLKQRGGWQVLGKTPSDSSLDFNNLFDHEVEDLSKSLTDDVGMNEDKARLLACNEFQRIYGSLKSTIFKKLVETLHKVFMIGSGEESEEQSYDICRAYGLLLNASAVTAKLLHEEISTQTTTSLLNEHKSLSVSATKTFATKSAQLSWDLLTTIPPLLSITPPTSYFREWHEKELAPTWNKELVNYDLVYYRPVLFMSCEGMVARKGWVGNTEASNHSPNDLTTDGPNITAQNCSFLSVERHDYKTYFQSSASHHDIPHPVPHHIMRFPAARSRTSVRADESDRGSQFINEIDQETTSKFYPQTMGVDTSGSSSVRSQKCLENWSVTKSLM